MGRSKQNKDYLQSRYCKGLVTVTAKDKRPTVEMFSYSKYTYRAFLRSVFMKYVENRRLELTHEKSDFFVDRVDQDEQEALTFFQMVFYQKS